MDNDPTATSFSTSQKKQWVINTDDSSVIFHTQHLSYAVKTLEDSLMINTQQL